MKLTRALRNTLVDELTRQCAGGKILLYADTPPALPEVPVEFQLLLAATDLPDPAFGPARDGEATAREIAPVRILATGEARWARLVSADDRALADLSVASVEANDLSEADMLIGQTDVGRNGTLSVDGMVLRLPAGPA